MKTIARGTFLGTNAELRTEVEGRVAAFKQALSDHAKSVGVPAPREDDLIEQLARSDEPWDIEPEPPQPEPLLPEDLAAGEIEAKRTAALRVLDEARLQTAASDPMAPQAVTDYADALATRPAI